MDIVSEVRKAGERIEGRVRKTPLEPSERLSELAGCRVFLKLENVQHTGTFKIRGVLNMLLSLTGEDRARGLITASTGNHGLALAYASWLLGATSIVCVPETADPGKVALLGRHGAEIVTHGAECAETEAFARSEGERTGRIYVPPYNDARIIAGHGTLAPEISGELPRIDRIYVAVGGGGLISGLGGYLRETEAGATVVGCLPANSPVMYESVKAGTIVETPVLPTLSDATAGGIEPGAITFDLCRRYVDDWVLVSEDEIRDAMRLVFHEHRIVIEGAAGVAVASLLKTRTAVGPSENAVVLLCGGNVDVEEFKRLVF